MAMTVFCPFKKEHGDCTRQIQCAMHLMCWYYQEMMREAKEGDSSQSAANGEESK